MKWHGIQKATSHHMSPIGNKWLISYIFIEYVQKVLRTISQHWFRKWFGTEHVTSYHMYHFKRHYTFTQTPAVSSYTGNKWLVFMYLILLRYRWSLFKKVQWIINQHWFRGWLGTKQVTSHYRYQCWPYLNNTSKGTSFLWKKTLAMSHPGDKWLITYTSL